jgi:diguanylate cyclase (GGDEF)-like protein
MTKPQTDQNILVEIIRAQTEIAKLGLDLGEVMSFVADRVRELTGAGGAIVELAEGTDMVYRAASGMAESQLGLRLTRDGSLSGLCVKLGEVLRCDDSDTDDRVNPEACRQVGLRSMLVAPLTHDGTTVGALKIASPKPAAFDESHVRILELMSELIAAAMFHAARNQTDELYYRATHDALTELANRALFYDRLRQQLAQADRRPTRFGVLNLDMDGLKPINDRFGHRAGDAAIRETADRIRRSSRETDTVARLGGDEFGVILSDVSSRRAAAVHLDRISGEIRRPFEFEGRPLGLDASVGLALYPDDGTDIETLIEKADKSMYEVKRGRKESARGTAEPG